MHLHDGNENCKKISPSQEGGGDDRNYLQYFTNNTNNKLEFDPKIIKFNTQFFLLNMEYQKKWFKDVTEKNSKNKMFIFKYGNRVRWKVEYIRKIKSKI